MSFVPFTFMTMMAMQLSLIHIFYESSKNGCGSSFVCFYYGLYKIVFLCALSNRCTGGDALWSDSWFFCLLDCHKRQKKMGGKKPCLNWKNYKNLIEKMKFYEMFQLL